MNYYNVYRGVYATDADYHWITNTYFSLPEHCVKELSKFKDHFDKRKSIIKSFISQNAMYIVVSPL